MTSVIFTAEWKAQAGEPQIPVDPPTELPSLTTLPSNLLEKQLPPAESLLAEVRRSKAASSDPKITSSFEAGMLWARSDSDDDVSTTIISNSASRTAATATAAADEVIEHVRDEEDSSASSSSVDGSVGQQEAMEWEAEIASELATGEGPVMRALTAYLRHVETAGDGGGSAWHWRLGTAIAKFDVPWSPDGCFPALFNRALALGVVSRRRIYSEAATLLGATPEWEPAPGFLNKLAWLAASSGAAIARRRLTRKAAAAAAAVQSGEFHASMARRREGMAAHGGVIRHWRWQSVLTDYLEALPEQPLEDAPAIVLVHGFGAFGEHWRGNAAALAAKGFAVYCPTLPGYGRGEKPSMRYGQDLWRDYLAEFVATVVRRPAVLAGNSIGGFISTSMAADYPGLVDGLVLVNSAGPVQEGYRPPTEPRKPSAPPRFIVEGVSSALFSFLEGDISKQLKRMYPVAPSRADAWLTEEIARAAGDPGALGVFRSVFYLPPPRALNYLVAEVFKGPVLVLQGGKDPLNDAPKRAKEIGRLCPNARVVMVDAGHCPHDEVPHVVNAALAEFVVKDVMGRGQKARSGAQVKQAVPVK